MKDGILLYLVELNKGYYKFRDWQDGYAWERVIWYGKFMRILRYLK